MTKINIKKTKIRSLIIKLINLGIVYLLFNILLIYQYPEIYYIEPIYLTTTILFLITFSAYYLYIKIFDKLVEFKKEEPMTIWMVLFLLAIVLVLIVRTIFFSAQIKTASSTNQDLIYNSFEANKYLAVYQMCVIAPIVEEMFFRGILMRVISNLQNKKHITVISAICSMFAFSVCHLFGAFSPIYAIMIFAVGFVLSFNYYFYHNMKLNILIHAVFNLSASLILFF